MESDREGVLARRPGVRADGAGLQPACRGSSSEQDEPERLAAVCGGVRSFGRYTDGRRQYDSAWRTFDYFAELAEQLFRGRDDGLQLLRPRPVARAVRI